VKSALLIALFMLPAAAPAQGPRDLPLPATGNVTLPLDEYNRMVEMATKPPQVEDGPPVPFLLKRAVLNLQVGAEMAMGTVQIDGEVLAAGTREVPLVNGMTILDGQQGGKPVPLEDAAGACQAVLAGPGEFAIALRAGVPLKVEAGRTGFSFPAPAAGVVELTVTIPGDRTNVNLSSGLITARRSVGSQTVIEAILPAGQPTEIWWATRESAPAPVPREVHFLSDVKTLVSVTEASLALSSLVNVTIVQGEADQFQIEIPAGYEATSADGAEIASSSTLNGLLTVKLKGAAHGTQQFLITMEKPIDAANQSNIAFPTVKGTQRETGEVLVESAGALEIGAKEGGALKRMDLKETSPYLRQLARDSVQAAFRYHRQAQESPALALEWVRFPDSALPAAIAEKATVTTLVTSEGKSLTEVKLLLANQAQPFLKVSLPAGATILSADVAGQAVKPLEGPDGRRVPLLRPGFRPNGLYSVSFVFMGAGTPFTKKGAADLTLPKIDLPVGVMEWEVFLPERYKVTDFGGNVTRAELMPIPDEERSAPLALPRAFIPPAGVLSRSSGGPGMGAGLGGGRDVTRLLAGQLGGIVVDPSGATVAAAVVTIANVDRGITRTDQSDAQGRWLVANIPSGRIRMTADAPGFQRQVREFQYDERQPQPVNVMVQLGSANETVELPSSTRNIIRESREIDQLAKQQAAAQQNAASANVIDLQRRVTGVLPVAVQVPKTGLSYRFVKPLVVDEEATVRFTYKVK
jgi:hypothetical protein